MSDKFFAGSPKAASTSVSIPIKLYATTTTAGVTGKVAADVTASYWRQGGSRTAIVTSNLAAVNSAYSSGGLFEVDGTNQPGLYRFDIPDAALATGADWVVISWKVTGAIDVHEVFSLSTYAPLATAVTDDVVETAGSYTLQQAMSIILAAVAGVTAADGATLKTPDGTATRIAATIASDNERTAITLTPSA